MNDLEQIVIQTLSTSIKITFAQFTFVQIFPGIKDHFLGTIFHILKHEILVYIM